MAQQAKMYPPVYIIALITVVAGAALAITALIWQPEKYLFKGMIFMAVSLLNLGGGEILNHPKQTIPDEESSGTPVEVEERKRNTCGLGNLMDIVGLMMFFVALSSFIYQR